MKEFVFNVAILLTGLLITGAGLHYYNQGKDSQTSRKIYRNFILLGIVITLFEVIKLGLDFID